MKKWFFKPRGKSAVLVNEEDLQDMIIKHGAGSKPNPNKNNNKKVKPKKEIGGD